MSTISKNKILTVAFIVLLLANIALLIFFLCCKGPDHKGMGGRDAMVKEFLQKEIAFTPQQLQQYDTLKKQHREKGKAFMDELRGKKETFMKELGSNAFSDSAIAVTAEKSAALQKEMEIKMLNHIREIRNLCTPDQQPNFDSLFYKILTRRRPETKK